MATKLEQRKTKLVFETADVVREQRLLRQVIVEAHPTYAQIKLKGLRRSYGVTWAGVYNLAVKLAVEQEYREKLEKRHAIRKTRR